MAPAPASSPLAEPATQERLSARRAGVLSSIFFGASVTESVSVNLLPLTLGLFTLDPSIIFWVLAINPAFGFIAQPLVGVLSDHVWTRFGRRAVFLAISGPIVAASLLATLATATPSAAASFDGDWNVQITSSNAACNSGALSGLFEMASAGKNRRNAS